MRVDDFRTAPRSHFKSPAPPYWLLANCDGCGVKEGKTAKAARRCEECLPTAIKMDMRIDSWEGTLWYPRGTVPVNDPVRVK
jgi:hypothetical protein